MSWNTIKQTSVGGRIGLALVCMLLGLALGGTFIVYADGNPNTGDAVAGPIVIPYDGFLMLDSAPLNGSEELTFTLYQQADGGSAVWSETQAVNIYNGRFSVGLGAVNSVNSTILDGEKMYLAIAIGPEESRVNLSGRQAIEPVPHAAWTANSADMRINGKATVGNDAPADVQLEIANNVAEDGAIDEYSDFQLSLFRSNTPEETYGLGIQSGTMFFNLRYGAAYKFYHGGEQPSMTLSDTNLDLRAENIRFGSQNERFVTFEGDRFTINPDADVSSVYVESPLHVVGDSFSAVNAVLSGNTFIYGANFDGTNIAGVNNISANSLTGTLTGQVVSPYIQGNPSLSIRTESPNGPNIRLDQSTDKFRISGGDVEIQTGLEVDGVLNLNGNVTFADNTTMVGNEATLSVNLVNAEQLYVRGSTSTFDVVRAGNGTANAGSVDVNNWASCGNNPVMAIRMVDPGGGLRMEVRCGRPD